jgi:hypothetical protein
MRGIDQPVIQLSQPISVQIQDNGLPDLLYVARRCVVLAEAEDAFGVGDAEFVLELRRCMSVSWWIGQIMTMCRGSLGSDLFKFPTGQNVQLDLGLGDAYVGEDVGNDVADFCEPGALLDGYCERISRGWKIAEIPFRFVTYS